MKKQAVSLYRFSLQDLSGCVKNAFNENPDLQKEKSIYFYSLELLENRLEHLKGTFDSENIIHAPAIKTNNLPGVLECIVGKGFGLEAASFEEVQLAAKAGCPNEKIIFDSPVKTREEIKKCDSLFSGMYLNVNCISELERLSDTENLNIGIRINPLIDTHAPGIFNVTDARSKFGIPISLKKEIIRQIGINNNINGLHVHAGSEIGVPESHVEAIGRVFDLAEDINERHPNRISFIDIGGGFPALMQQGEQQGLEQMTDALKKRCPGIFDNYTIITEYGRFVHAHNAFVLSRVEYVLEHHEINTALIHVGADLFLREVYSSHPPYHELAVLDSKGNLKSGKEKKYDIGGPLCFSGDYLQKEIRLPEINEGDYILIADTGANTISMWSGHCSREKPRIHYIENT